MPKLSNALPKYRKHSSGQARVTINGRDYLLGPWKSKTSIREYDRVIAEYLASGRSPTYGIESGGYTVAMFVRDYLSHCRTWYGTDTNSEFHRIKPALKPLLDLYRDHLANEFGPTGFKAVRQSMIESGLTRQGINTRMARIVRAFKWGATEEKFPQAVYKALSVIDSIPRGRTAAPDTKPIRPVEDSVVDATLPHLSPVVADMIRVQRLIACRPSEVCNLTPGSFDRSDDVWVATLEEHKTAHRNHTRNLYIGPQAQEIIEPYLLRDDDVPLFRPCDAVKMRQRKDALNRITPLSCGNRPGKRSGGLAGKRARKKAGDQYTTASYRRAIHYACDKAFPAPEPLKQRDGESNAARRNRLTEEQRQELNAWQSKHRWSPNRLRHSRATEVRKNFGLEAAQVTLGHRRIQTTQTYAQRNEALGKKVAREAG